MPPVPPPGGAELGLPLLLQSAADWFNDALIDAIEGRGWPRLSRSQSLVFVSIDPDGTRPAELARRLGITRQSMQELLVKLEEHELITVEPDRLDGRANVVRLAPRAAELGSDAAMVTAALERELADRIGRRDVGSLRRIVGRRWGPPPNVEDQSISR
ncbi:hypothetical protein BH18ACT2_BH18ACT2_24170 [soil metagenome]